MTLSPTSLLLLSDRVKCPLPQFKDNSTPQQPLPLANCTSQDKRVDMRPRSADRKPEVGPAWTVACKGA